MSIKMERILTKRQKKPVGDKMSHQMAGLIDLRITLVLCTGQLVQSHKALICLK
jgi:hypothetical protein